MTEQKHNILIVDDEENILNSLTRSLKRDGYRIIRSLSAERALPILEAQPVTVVISDYKMPSMNGIEFLSLVRQKHPEIIRIMLTGFADIESIIASINKGEVYRFITKPWDDEELRFVIQDAVRHYEIIEENKRLQKLTQLQNKELRDLNAKLELKVQERTREIKELYTALERNFFDFIRVFVNLLQLKSPYLGGRAKRVASLSKRFAERLKLSHDEILNIEIAALLQDIGTLGFPEEILKKRESQLDQVEKAIMEQHPLLGQSALQHIDKLCPVALLIRYHHERYDRLGYPDNIGGSKIPLGSRIIAIVDYFDNLINPYEAQHRYSIERALYEIEREKGKRFDPELVDEFIALLREGTYNEFGTNTIEIDIDELEEGMILASDIRTRKGLLLIAKGEVINASHIKKIQNFHSIDPVVTKITIRKN